MKDSGSDSARDSGPQDEGDAKRGYGKLAGWALLLGSLLVVPSSRLAQPPPELVDYLPTLLGAVSGVILIRFPWERHDVSAFHVVAVIGALEIALAARMLAPLYTYFFFLVAIYVAYVYADWNQVVPHLVFLSLLTCLPLLHSPETTQTSLRSALFAIPVLWIGAVIVSHMRNQLEQRLRAYRQLAAETGELAVRIRRSAGGFGDSPQ